MLSRCTDFYTLCHADGSSMFPQDLKAKGALPPHIMHLVEESVSRQVVINDAPPAIRFNLTRRAVQDDIGRRTGTSVVVRGQYYSPGQVHGEEKPLHLKITPGVVLSQVKHFAQSTINIAMIVVLRFPTFYLMLSCTLSFQSRSDSKKVC